MLWYEITASVPHAQLEEVAALMRGLAPGGLSIEEPIDPLGPEMGYRVRHDEPVLVRAYLPASELGAVLVEEFRRALDAYPAVEVTAKPLYEQDWTVAWREFFGIVRTGSLVVVPTWKQFEPAPGDHVILLDPGQAFGTGHHETTRLCLAAIEEHTRPGAKVLDIGTGSGILAIAAIHCGAATVAALDVDTAAIEVARQNLVANGVAAPVRLERGTLDAGHPGRYDLLVANISTEVHLALAQTYAAVLEPGGVALLSGILASRAAEVRAALEPAALRFTGIAVERDWCLLTFALPGRSASPATERSR